MGRCEDAGWVRWNGRGGGYAFQTEGERERE